MLALMPLRQIARRIPFARAAWRALSPAAAGAPRPAYGRDYLREVLAGQFLRGEGIEIGALHSPLLVPAGVKARYVDRSDLDGLRKHYGAVKNLPFVPVDVVDDGERLHKFAAGSQDFIIANHFLEHTQDPIGTLRRFIEVLRPGGVLFLALPDKRFTFDAERRVTPVEHMIRDHEEGPAWSSLDHLYEFSREVQRLDGDALEEHVRSMKAENYSIHFHVWTHETFLRFLLDVRDRYAIPFTLEANVLNRTRDETVVILRKRDPEREPIEP